MEINCFHNGRFVCVISTHVWLFGLVLPVVVLRWFFNLTFCFISRVILDIIMPVWPLINATNSFLTFDLPFRFVAPSYSQLTSLYSSLGRMEENDIELDHDFLEEHRANEDRRTLLQGLESVFSKFGYEGEACVQRAICELVQTPIMHNGLLGKAINLLL